MGLLLVGRGAVAEGGGVPLCIFGEKSASAGGLRPVPGIIVVGVGVVAVPLALDAAADDTAAGSNTCFSAILVDVAPGRVKKKMVSSSSCETKLNTDAEVLVFVFFAGVVVEWSVTPEGDTPVEGDVNLLCDER